MKNQSLMHRKILAVILFTTLICFGCATKKVALEKISRADQAVRQASQKETSRFASLEITMAINKLEEAKKAEDDGEYKKAGWLAEESLVNAQLAESKLASIKMEQNAEETRKSMEAIRGETQRNRQLQDLKED